MFSSLVRTGDGWVTDKRLNRDVGYDPYKRRRTKDTRLNKGDWCVESELRVDKPRDTDRMLILHQLIPVNRTMSGDLNHLDS